MRYQIPKNKPSLTTQTITIITISALLHASTPKSASKTETNPHIRQALQNRLLILIHAEQQRTRRNLQKDQTHKPITSTKQSSVTSNTQDKPYTQTVNPQSTDSTTPVKGECTPGSCIYCNTDGISSWCESCANGKYITASKGPSRRCSEKDINIPNCYFTDPATPDNPDSCFTCKVGFYLKDPKTCAYINFPNCDYPVKEGNIFKCYGCEKQFVKDDLSGCAGNDNFPENCFYGGKVSNKDCFVCDYGYTLQGVSLAVSERSGVCVKSKVVGCSQYVKGSDTKCSVCSVETGFYAVGARRDDDNNLIQICQLAAGRALGWSAGFMLSLWALN